MQPVERITWSATERDLWRRIEAHDFEPAGQALTFTRRLARDRNWTLDFARGAIDEYRRFCFLATVGGIEVTPSEEVDEVWHQHLTYSRDYWTRWCPDVLRADLHHQPTAGGPAEQARFAGQYAATLALYEAYFGRSDPGYWPGIAERFRLQPRYRIVDRDRALAVPLPAGVRPLLRRVGARCGLASLFSWLATGAAEAQPLNPLDWTAEPFLTLYVVLAVGVVLAAYAVRGYLAEPRLPGRGTGLGPIELAYIAGGPARAADTLIVGLLEAGAASFDKREGIITIAPHDRTLPDDIARHRMPETGSFKRAQLVSGFAAGLAPVKEDLIGRGLVPRPDRIKTSRIVTVCIISPVVVFGLAKIVVGASRDKPVGFLIVLVVMTVIAGLVMMAGPRRTLAGEAARRDYLEAHERAARAPRLGELALAFALAGPAALAGTALADYGGFLKTSDGGGCGGGGGDGGGGGGCGGCGGGS